VDGNKGIKQSPMHTEGDYETESRELGAENEPKKKSDCKSGARKIKKGFRSADQTQRESNYTERPAAPKQFKKTDLDRGLTGGGKLGL
jgi:hypothetical protein